MKMRTFIIALLTIFSFSISAQSKQQVKKTLVFDVNKTLANIEKISNEGYIIKMKGNIIEKIEGDYYWFQDTSGKIKVKIEPNKISKIGEYSNETVFYIIGSIENIRSKTFVVSEITKP